MDITTIGFDLAKTVFQVHGADGEGRAVLRRKLRRGKVLAFFAGLPSCLVGMEACASAHYWAREIQARDWARSKAICMPSHVSGVEPKAFDSR